MDPYLALIAGAATLVAAAAAWLGRWRGWTRTFITSHLPVPLTILPAFGGMLVASGACQAGPSAVPFEVVAATLVIGVVALVLALWNPPWFGPAWYRELKASEQQIEPDLSDPLTAATYALAGSNLKSPNRAPHLIGGASALARWRVSLVKGAAKVGGHLVLHRAGISFYPHALERRMGGNAYPLTLSSEEVSSVRTIERTVFEVETEAGHTHQFTVIFPKRIVKRLDAELCRH